MMSKFSKTTPGVLALTDSDVAGRSNPSRRSTLPSVPNDLIGCPVFLSSAQSYRAIGEHHSIARDNDAAVTKATRRRDSAAWVERPELAASRGVEREDAKFWRRRVEHSVDDDRIRLHLRSLEFVVCLVRPRDLQLGNVPRSDLVDRRVVRVIGVPAVDGPVDVLLRQERDRKRENR